MKKLLLVISAAALLVSAAALYVIRPRGLREAWHYVRALHS